jgi:beta-glucanase (GH16 family)
VSWVSIFLLAACTAANGGGNPAETCDAGSCASGDVGGAAPVGAGGSGNASPIGAGGSTLVAPATGGTLGAGSSPVGSGGLPPASGGLPPSTGGQTGDGGSVATGGAPSGDGGETASGGTPASIPDHTLVVDAPRDGATVQGTVTVSGRAPGFLNVEAWDATHTNPPLAQATPASDGTFSTTVDASSLASGATTWTVHAWDSPPGQSFDNTASVTLNLTIDGSSVDPCAGQTCSNHGSCSAPGGRAACTCEGGFHAVGLACVADSTGGGTPDPGTTCVPAGYQLIFSDEFSSGSLDTSKWNTLAPYGVQWYSDSNQKQAFVPQAVSQSGGLVTFTATRSNGGTNGQPYASGSITTNRTFTYGYYEARARVPAGKGFWPAYWLTSSTRWPPEWDIFEIIDGVIFGYTHPVAGGKCTFVEGAAGSDSTYTMPNLYGTFHVYGFRWTSTDIYWYVDGTLTEHYSINAAAGAADPFWLNLSLQVGGDWPGDPSSSTPFPGHMDVDYVRVYQP